jgi:hypothetical protein
MPILKLRDQTGATILVNSGAWTHIAQAADLQTKSPLLGYSLIFFTTYNPDRPNAILVKGSPEEIAAQIEAQEQFALTQ